VTGKSYLFLALVAIGYLFTAASYGTLSRGELDQAPPPQVPVSRL
jgi:hypothetical protein